MFVTLNQKQEILTPLFFCVDFSSQDKNVQARLDEVADAHEDVLASISQLSATLAEVQLHNYRRYWRS